MGFNRENYKKIRDEYLEKNLRAREAAERRADELHRLFPDIAEIDRILAEVAKAAAKQMDAARGTFEVEITETEPGKGPTKQVKKGPVLQSVVGAAVVQNAAGETVMICGIPEEAKNAALRAGKL